MVKLSISITSNRLPALAAAFPAATRALVGKTVADLEAASKGAIVDLDAVDTSEMLNAVAGTVLSDTEGEVVVGAAHSIFVHEGTIHMAARPFFNIATERVRPQFEAAAAHLVSGLV